MSKSKARRVPLALVGLASVAASLLTVSAPAQADGGTTTVDVLRQSSNGLQVTTQEAASPAAAQTLVESLRHQNGVVSASIGVVRNLSGSASPSDPALAQATHLAQIKAEAAWSKSTGKGVVVAVLDTGIDSSHPELAGALLPAVDFGPRPVAGVTETHGTAVAGTIAARAGNGIGAAGVAPDATILPIRVCGGGCPTSAVARGIIYAADHGAQVINLSLGSAAPSQVEKAAIDYAIRRGLSIVAAAGNGGLGCLTDEDPALDQCDNLVEYPAAFDGVISVSAANAQGTSAWATHNDKVALSAPGSGIFVPKAGGGFTTMDGTSFSAPEVSGAVAAMLAVNPRLKAADSRRILVASAAGQSWSTKAGYGAGILDVAAAVEKSAADGTYPLADGSVDYIRGGVTTNVKGAILGRYQAAGAEKGGLGWPVTSEIAVPGGAYSVFEGAFVVWSPSTGPQIVYGDNLPRWLSLGATNSVLGFPSTEEIKLTGGVVQRFTGGNLYWSPATGSQEVHGAILGKYASAGWENGFLGYPTTNEVALTAGAFSSFQGGSIYWSPSTGAHFVKGAILQSWGTTGWENGYVGYPTSDEYSWNGGIRQDFQGKSLFFSWKTGKVTEVR